MKNTTITWILATIAAIVTTIGYNVIADIIADKYVQHEDQNIASAKAVVVQEKSTQIESKAHDIEVKVIAQTKTEASILYMPLVFEAPDKPNEVYYLYYFGKYIMVPVNMKEGSIINDKVWIMSGFFEDAYRKWLNYCKKHTCGPQFIVWNCELNCIQYRATYTVQYDMDGYGPYLSKYSYKILSNGELLKINNDYAKSFWTTYILTLSQK